MRHQIFQRISNYSIMNILTEFRQTSAQEKNNVL